MAHRIPENAIAIAFKAIALAPGFSGEARRVAGAILDHYNRRTGRCDPSNARLAGLLGISERTVRKATSELCPHLFEKKSHGGHSHCSSYRPRWQTFREIVTNWEAEMKGSSKAESSGSNRPKRSSSTGPNVPVEQAHLGLQTHSINPSDEPEPVSPESKAGPDSSKRIDPKGPGRRGAGQQLHGVILYSLPGGRDTSRRDAAEAAEQRRLTREINKLASVEARKAAWLAVMDATKAD